MNLFNMAKDLKGMEKMMKPALEKFMKDSGFVKKEELTKLENRIKELEDRLNKIWLYFFRMPLKEAIIPLLLKIFPFKNNNDFVAFVISPFENIIPFSYEAIRNSVEQLIVT